MINKAMLPDNQFNSCTSRLFNSKTQLSVRLRCGHIVDDVELSCAPSRDCDDSFYSESEGTYWNLSGRHGSKRIMDIVAVGKRSTLLNLDTRQYVCVEDRNSYNYDDDHDIWFELNRYDHFDKKNHEHRV